MERPFAAMTYRISISSVQREFAKERNALADYIRKDMMFGGCFNGYHAVAGWHKQGVLVW